jgi:hypothetical protein
MVRHVIIVTRPRDGMRWAEFFCPCTAKSVARRQLKKLKKKHPTWKHSLYSVCI